ncbi:MAG TPA: hypothetical protein PLM53_01455 [Spirochaetota bacterium]|nr:hypothetical protein [Spirochaetota bacterium]HPC41956.1 hypothetical protein [Spirochaetota bacterium]HPL17010.1 hypothetical protein [Spirochaetota bacterium]HQF06998.1 hypothetical protein [Spirochaetota bacterium]HQH95735.1 hypothetical protein [Spirochaetota bacterium]
MVIETTINIHIDCLMKLSDIARRTGMSRTMVIAHLLKYAMDVREKDIRCGRRVRYQAREKADGWHTLHVKLRPDDYEYLLDLRKLLKMSVSLILSIAVTKYLKRIMTATKGDNNQIQNYMITKRIIDGITHWTFIWGYPPNIEAYFSPSGYVSISNIK